MSSRNNDNRIALFHGDSVTEPSRSCTEDLQLGAGYAMMIASWFSAIWSIGLLFSERMGKGAGPSDPLWPLPPTPFPWY